MVIKESPGGSGLNVAYGLFLLGYDVDFYSNVGNDHRGKHIVKILNDKGFDISCMRIIRSGRTGLFIAFNDKPLAVEPGVNREKVDVPLTMDDYDLVFATGEVPEETLEIVCKRGHNVVIDIGPRAKIDTTDLKVLVIGNEEECSRTRCDVVKMGPKGARWGDLVAAASGEPFPYSLGLGDLFDAVLIHGLIRGRSRNEALEEAVEYTQLFGQKDPVTPFERISQLEFLNTSDKASKDHDKPGDVSCHDGQ
ncbi:PfkB family carbohydrate kinase [Thermotoga sp.]|uniref:PfkB family carbohydrate kinase n=1 Tax=Thermotoga sp. TaxID=28240 RepID=UPI0025CEA984|nr:PfkB family carbohydrate kinase [Thermotoga sp.]